ncbi:MAG: AI-2E family transporter [Ruminococcaceae bacterium]|nr:AI-2E family transporter [Oscillospiraceae bacterium]
MKLDWKTCLRVGVSIFLLYLGIHYWSLVGGFLAKFLGALSPLILGGVIAYIVNILMSLFERHFFPKAEKRWVTVIRRPVCLVLAVICLLAMIGLILGLILPELALCIQLLFAKLPDAMEEVVALADQYHLLPDNITEFLENIDWASRIGQLVDVISNGVGDVMDVVVKTVSSVFSGIVTALLGMIFALYLLIDKDRLQRQVTRVMTHYLPHNWNYKLRYVLRTMNDCFRKYIVGQCVEAVILGVLCTLGMLILRLPYATMIGALIAFTALIPVAGAYIGAGVGALMILTVSPMKALIFLIFLVVLQQLEGNLIYPKVVGSSMGLPGIWVLAAVTVGGGMMGVLGMLLGVPLVATLYRLLQDDVNGGEKAVLRKRKHELASAEAPEPTVPDTSEE